MQKGGHHYIFLVYCLVFIFSFNTETNFSWKQNKKLENIILNPSFNCRYQLFRMNENFKNFWNFEQVKNPPLKKVKKNIQYFPSFYIHVYVSIFEFQWKIYFKNCLYNPVLVLVHTEEKTKKRLSISLACDERFVSTNTLSLHGQAFDVLYEMSEPQRICLHLVLFTILRKKNIIPLAH